MANLLDCTWSPKHGGKLHRSAEMVCLKAVMYLIPQPQLLKLYLPHYLQVSILLPCQVCSYPLASASTNPGKSLYQVSMCSVYN
jgi:hypothetical protein